MKQCYLCNRKTIGLVVQLVRMPPCHGGGRGFESRPDRKNLQKRFRNGSLFFCFYKFRNQKMEYIVYILYSKNLDVYYKGFTQNLEQRLEDHLEGKSNFTSNAKDWILMYNKEFKTKKEALIEEKRLKKLNRLSIEKIIKG